MYTYEGFIVQTKLRSQKSNTMKKLIFNVFLSLFLSISLSAQVVYDTLPKEEELEIGGLYFEEYFTFKDFEKQAQDYFDKVDFKAIDCYGRKVFVATTFGKDGIIKNTRILRAVSPTCDSIAFYFVDGLKDWLPGTIRNRPVSIDFVFPIVFDSLKIKKFYNDFNENFKAKEKNGHGKMRKTGKALWQDKGKSEKS